MYLSIYLPTYLSIYLSSVFYSYGFPIAVPTSASNRDKAHQIQDLAGHVAWGCCDAVTPWGTKNDHGY